MTSRLAVFWVTAVVLIAGSAAPASSADPAGVDAWPRIEGEHFVVVAAPTVSGDLARTVLRRAEEFYTTIADEIGYSRYRKFWTWEDRVRIVIYPDQTMFSEATGQPAWSLGYAAPHSRLFQSKVIVTFVQEEHFLDGLLPHEITHLIMRDFMGTQVLPMWFEEGVAQLHEASKTEQVRAMITYLVHEHATIPFTLINQWDIRRERNALAVSIFYGQSLSMVRFLVTNYGQDAFRDLCRDLRDGAGMEAALKKTYYPTIDSWKSFEEKWMLGSSGL